MNARIITALLALLGFGAACSGVKETAKSTDSRADSVRVQRPIRLMYGVPVREFQARPLADSARGEGRLPSAVYCERGLRPRSDCLKKKKETALS